MSEGFTETQNTIGFVGSIVGIFAGIASIVNFVDASVLTVGAHITEVAIWFLWLIIQGVGFLIFYRERNENAALVAFVFAIISALIEVSILLMMLSQPDIIDFGAALTSLIQLLIAILVGSFSEAAYLIFGGVVILHVTRHGARESLGYATSIVFILSGCFILLGLFGALSFFIPFFLIAANILACLVFVTPLSSKDLTSEITKVEYGLELE